MHKFDFWEDRTKLKRKPQNKKTLPAAFGKTTQQACPLQPAQGA